MKIMNPSTVMRACRLTSASRVAASGSRQSTSKWLLVRFPIHRNETARRVAGSPPT